MDNIKMFTGPSTDAVILRPVLHFIAGRIIALPSLSIWAGCKLPVPGDFETTYNARWLSQPWRIWFSPVRKQLCENKDGG